MDAIMASKGLVKPFDPWDQGFAKLQSKLGPPTSVKGDNYRWAVAQGDDCAYVYISKDDAKKLHAGEGFVVGTVATPMKVDKSSPPGNREECFEILGKDLGPPEDPNAAGPPADGKATVAMVLDNAVKARSKWNDAKVTVTGTLGQVSTSTSTSAGTTVTTTTLALLDPKDKDKTHPLSCTLDAAPANKLGSGKPITVTGTVKIQKWVSGGGETTFEAELAHCALK
jgi:hypothetical protein